MQMKGKFDDEEWNKLLHSDCYVDDEERYDYPTPELFLDMVSWNVYVEGQTVIWSNGKLMGKFVYDEYDAFPEEWPSWLVTNFACKMRGSPVNYLITPPTTQSKLFWIDTDVSN
jgi:hypothetical protein